MSLYTLAYSFLDSLKTAILALFSLYASILDQELFLPQTFKNYLNCKLKKYGFIALSMHYLSLNSNIYLLFILHSSNPLLL